MTRERDRIGIDEPGEQPVSLRGIEYFVETTRADGSSAESFASGVVPASVTIAPPPLVSRFTATRRRTKLTILGSFLDFATFDRRTMDGASVARLP